uniref:Uncharacterized protein n=1 Tax=Guillardia theta TaxID=55529 RepID=A0A7S4L092_GUITH|mmetsp:Transcript_34935/g.109219  ORF Transcript_34935/g.109219 Transcript_34935/m.109219 type:complete len:139 (+) Transcript_34935:36-452(+)
MLKKRTPPQVSSVWWMLEVGTRRLYKNWERIVTIGEGRCSCKEDEELLLACTRGLHVLLLHAIPMMEVVEEVSLRIWGTNAEKALVEVCGTLDEVDWEGREVARRVGLPIDEREIRMIVMLLEESLRHVNEVRRNAEE